MLLSVSLGDQGKAWEEETSPEGWKHILLEGENWLVHLLLGILGNTKVFSKGQIALFTACQGLLWKNKASAVDIQLYNALADLFFMIWRGQFLWNSLSAPLLTHVTLAAWRWCLFLPRWVMWTQTDHRRFGPAHRASALGRQADLYPGPSIIDGMLLTHGRWQHNTSQVGWIFHMKAVQSQHTHSCLKFGEWIVVKLGHVSSCLHLLQPSGNVCNMIWFKEEVFKKLTVKICSRFRWG